MITRRHHLYRRIRGRVMHITGVKGLCGILRDGCISPNPSGRFEHSLSGARPGYYVCQRHNAISLLDLKSADEKELFDPQPPQNWAAVFTYHRPAIILLLNGDRMRGRLTPVRALAEKTTGLAIVEAEACHAGEIPTSWIVEGLVVGARRNVIYSSVELSSVLSRAQAVERRSRRDPRKAILRDLANGRWLSPSKLGLLFNL
jgi:hypothetical protein